MRRVGTVILAGAAISMVAAPAFAAGLDRGSYRYTRTLRFAGHGPVALEPDRRMYAHSQSALADLRIVDRDGRQVPWRKAPTLSDATGRPVLLRRPARSVRRREHGSRSVIRIDLGYENLPVDEITIGARKPRYDRPVTIFGSNNGRDFMPIADGRAVRFSGSPAPPLAVHARHRYLRVVIDNGSDDPLAGARLAAFSRSRSLLLESGHPGPFSAFYGSPTAGFPDYDFAELPQSELGIDRRVQGHLTVERLNPAYEPPPDTRSFTARHPALVTAALVLGALALSATGFIALRRPNAPSANG